MRDEDRTRRQPVVRVCVDCKQESDDWRVNTRVVVRCRDCQFEANTRNKNKGRKQAMRKWQLRRLYNMSLEEYDLLWEKQNGTCAICKQINANGRRLSIDHDHSTGEIRGLLCARCNTMLGWVDLYSKEIDTYLSGRLQKCP